MSISKSEYIDSVFKYINSNCDVLLSDYIIVEYERAINSEKLAKYNCFNILNHLSYKKVKSINHNDKQYIKIRDDNDYQVLYDAIKSDADILLTNDKDFNDIVINKPRILNLKQFSEEFMR